MSNKSAVKLFSDLSVLLVDDIDSNRIVVINILRRYSMKIDTASTGIEAISQLQKNDYDIILMDLAMPEMDGVTAARAIRKEFNSPKKDIPIIALTASLIQESEDKVFNAGMNACIAKPVVSKELLDIISRFTNSIPGDEMSIAPQSGSGRYPVNDRLDLSYLFEVSGGDKLFTADLIENFVSNTPSILKGIKVKLEEGNIVECRKFCHKLKPQLSYMGLKHITPMFLKFQENLRKEPVNIKGELLILNKLDEMITDSIINLQKVKENLLSDGK